MFLSDGAQDGVAVTVTREQALAAAAAAGVPYFTLGEGTKIDNQVHLAHNVQIGARSLLCGQVGIGGDVSQANGDDLLAAERAELFGIAATHEPAPGVEGDADIVLLDGLLKRR